jgi:hypothetical protein
MATSHLNRHNRLNTVPASARVDAGRKTARVSKLARELLEVAHVLGRRLIVLFYIVIAKVVLVDARVQVSTTIIVPYDKRQAFLVFYVATIAAGQGIHEALQGVGAVPPTHVVAEVMVVDASVVNDELFAFVPVTMSISVFFVAIV